MTPNPLVVDLSHWDPANDYSKVKAAGIVGVIYKATQGTSSSDITYMDQRRMAKAAGLLWGSYHFATGAKTALQAQHYLKVASVGPDELFCLDWEDNGGDKMSASQVEEWITTVEAGLNRPGQCVLYSGNTAKEALGSSRNTFLGSRRLWLAQYGMTPVPQASWSDWWLWQYTDGRVGPTPHAIPGIGNCDINSYKGAAAQLTAEWSGAGDVVVVPPVVPPPVPGVITVTDELSLQKAINSLGSQLTGAPLVEDGFIGPKTFAKLDELIKKFRV